MQAGSRSLVTGEKLRAQFDWLMQRVLERAEPEVRARLERRLAKLTAKGDRYKHLRRDAENKPGTYRIGCEYASSEPDFWNGRVQSEISVEIYFEKTSSERVLELHE